MPGSSNRGARLRSGPKQSGRCKCAVVLLAATMTNAEASFYDSAAGKIVVDERGTAEEMALAIAHAAHHARSDEAGSRAEVERETRADSVAEMIAEEAAAVVATIETKRDL